MTFESEKNNIRYISADNVEEFYACLDPVSVQNVVREFYGGICVYGKDSEPAAVAVYELKNAEEEEDTEAELTYISISDENCGKTLFEALYKEFSEEDVKRIYFEFEKLSPVEEKL